MAPVSCTIQNSMAPVNRTAKNYTAPINGPGKNSVAPVNSISKNSMALVNSTYKKSIAPTKSYKTFMVPVKVAVQTCVPTQAIPARSPWPHKLLMEVARSPWPHKLLMEVARSPWPHKLFKWDVTGSIFYVGKMFLALINCTRMISHASINCTVKMFLICTCGKCLEFLLVQFWSGRGWGQMSLILAP